MGAGGKIWYNKARPVKGASTVAEKQMRLDRFLCEAAGLTRAAARRAVMAGRVTVAGTVCKKADARIEPAAAVTLDGAPLHWQEHVYLMLHKPAGVVSASRDGRDTTVTDLAAAAYPRRTLFPAGRLDKDSTGLILLTDDGPLAHALLSPARHVAKVYEVTLDTPLTPAMQAGFAAGVTLADGTALAPAAAAPLDGDPCRVQVTLRQGVYHQIKRMFGVYGAGVEALHRMALGPLTLDPALAPGQWRELTADEVAALRQC